jgi:hypothetical protein
VADFHPGDTFRLRVVDGEVGCRVEDVSQAEIPASGAHQGRDGTHEQIHGGDER